MFSRLYPTVERGKFSNFPPTRLLNVAVRRECGAHHAYSIFRSAQELLEAGQHYLPPISQFAKKRSSYFLVREASKRSDHDNESSEIVSETEEPIQSYDSAPMNNNDEHVEEDDTAHDISQIVPEAKESIQIYDFTTMNTIDDHVEEDDTSHAISQFISETEGLIQSCDFAPIENIEEQDVTVYGISQIVSEVEEPIPSYVFSPMNNSVKKDNAKYMKTKATKL